jgi:hypothetical protein
MMFGSNTRSGPLELARAVGTKARELAGMLRRMVVTRTNSAIWQVTGHTLLDGDTETRDVELFGGIGFYARPNDDDDTEAIVAFPAGGSGGPIIVAVRQEARRRVMTTDLASGETQLHNSSADNPTIIRIKANGTVEIRALAGVAAALALKADVQALRDWVNNQFSSAAGHIHVVSGAATTTMTTVAVPGSTPTVPAPTPVGTTVLKGQ